MKLQNRKLVQIMVDLCSLNYIRPMLLFSKEKLRNHVLRIVKHNEYYNFIHPQNKFLATRPTPPYVIPRQ